MDGNAGRGKGSERPPLEVKCPCGADLNHFSVDGQFDSPPPMHDHA
jgi:hypothetical protein